MKPYIHYMVIYMFMLSSPFLVIYYIHDKINDSYQSC